MERKNAWNGYETEELNGVSEISGCVKSGIPHIFE